MPTKRPVQAENAVHASPDVGQQFAERLRQVEETQAGLADLVRQVLTAKSAPSAAGGADEALLEGTGELRNQLVNRSIALELYALHLALALVEDDLGDVDEFFQSRATRLARQLDAESTQAIRDLVGQELGLRAEGDRFFGAREGRVREFEKEITRLREALGFPVHSFDEGPEVESEEAE